MTSTRLQVLSGEASKGSAVILSLITILCCGIIFVGLVWVPFVIKSSKSYLQVVVDELCLRLYQELPFTANFNGFTWEVPADNSAFATALSRVLTMINFGNNPVAFVGVVPSQRGRLGPMFNGTLQEEDLVIFRVDVQPIANPPRWLIIQQLLENRNQINFPAQLEDHFQVLHPTRSENSVVICFSQGALNRAAWMLPFVQQNQDLTVSAISGLFQNISNINSPPLLNFTRLVNTFAVNTYPSPLVLFELDENNQNAQDNFRVCFQQADTVTCQNQGGPQQFNVRRVAKKLTAIHLINLLARNGATRHSTRVGVVRSEIGDNQQQVVRRSIFKGVADDSITFSSDPVDDLVFPEDFCNYYNRRKLLAEDLFFSFGPPNSFGFRAVNCGNFGTTEARLDLLDFIYSTDLNRGWGTFGQTLIYEPFEADELQSSPHIIWIGTNPATLEIFLRTVLVPAIGTTNVNRPVVTAILFPTTDVSINMLGAILANLDLIDFNTRSQQIEGLTFRAPFFKIFVFDRCGYIDVPNRASVTDDPPSPYWECLSSNNNELDDDQFQTFLQAFAESNVMPAFPQGIPVAPYVQQGEIPGNTIAERLAIFIYRQFLISRGWLF